MPNTLELETWKLIFDQSPIGIAIVNSYGEMIKCNDAFANILGYTKDEFVRKTFQEITHPADLKADMDQFQKIKEGKIDYYEMQQRYLSKSGRIIWTTLTVHGLIYNNEQHYVSHIRPVVNGELFKVQTTESGEKTIRPIIKLNEFFKDNWKWLSTIIVGAIAWSFNTYHEIQEYKTKINKNQETIERLLLENQKTIIQEIKEETKN